MRSPHCYIESLVDRALDSDLQLEARHGVTTIGEGDMRLKQRKPHLGDPERKERVPCNDCKTVQRVEMFGTKYDSHAVRGLCGL
jgi:hypothetical protein